VISGIADISGTSAAHVPILTIMDSETWAGARPVVIAGIVT
jgi:hypothetical protein